MEPIFKFVLGNQSVTHDILPIADGRRFHGRAPTTSPYNQRHPTSPDQTHICVGDQSTWRAYFTAAAIRATDDEPRIIGLTIAEQLQTRTN